MLVWQDFPLQWGYDDSPEFANEAVRQAKAMLTVLHHHPSIFAWSGHNEPPWNAPWMKYKYPDYKPQQNRYLTDAVGAVWQVIKHVTVMITQQPMNIYGWMVFW